jgi:hypothetical protein
MPHSLWIDQIPADSYANSPGQNKIGDVSFESRFPQIPPHRLCSDVIGAAQHGTWKNLDEVGLPRRHDAGRDQCTGKDDDFVLSPRIRTTPTSSPAFWFKALE